MPAADRLRIAIVLPSSSGGGAEHVGTVWAEELRRRGHDCVVLETHPKTDRPLDRATTRRLHVSHGGAVLRSVRRVVALRRAIEREHPDLVLSLLTFQNLLCLAATASLPAGRRPRLVISERNMPTLILGQSGPRGRLQLLAARFWYRRADAVIAISHAVAASLLSRFAIDPSRCWVVPNPTALVDLADREALIATQEPQDGPIRVVMPFRYVRQKQPLRGVRTAAELHRRGVPVELHLVGDGPLLERVRTAAKEADLPVVAHGWKPDWYGRLPPRSVVLLPSDYEGFGNVLVEAASVGAPSVACSAAMGVADAIVPDVTGVLSPSPAARDLADAVLRADALRPVRTEWLRRFSREESTRVLLRVLTTVTKGPEGEHA